MGKSLAPVSLLTKNHKKIMKLIKSSQHKAIQIFLNRGSKIQEGFLTLAETPSYVVYGWASVLSYGQHILSSAGESDCNYQSNKYEFPSQIIFRFSWQWSHPSQNQLHIASETTGYLMLLGCTICLILSPFPQPHCPLCAVNPFGYCHSVPCAGKFLSGHVAHLLSHCTMLILKHWKDNICICIYFP